mgnify:CR=1 FL=1
MGTTTTGYLKVSITTEMVKGGVDDDGMTEVSAMTGITSSLELNEQDLSGAPQQQAYMTATGVASILTAAARCQASTQHIHGPPAICCEWRSFHLRSNSHVVKCLVREA